jgi:hypothetical protein
VNEGQCRSQFASLPRTLATIDDEVFDIRSSTGSRSAGFRLKGKQESNQEENSRSADCDESRENHMNLPADEPYTLSRPAFSSLDNLIPKSRIKSALNVPKCTSSNQVRAREGLMHEGISSVDANY